MQKCSLSSLDSNFRICFCFHRIGLEIIQT
ncbi:hypothetical protein E1A91_A11G013500v1 [Gossypium mustelinum]|uniref:Uncharacterized protein n=1 Tax=Gossypium mustelinum TaxID=34275 RepID=A0A5D2X138_GOSMU|nr:hypothetical protein E1A91_A11G013500v1 [Gossypium mustelinum]